ncbi:hypothetical protein ACW5XW_08230 [Aeromonas piscicola]|uniref:hypothetical protein n=1 Tax=Aeromonas piscicola TaxID=600645 RepID=UPI0005B52505|nr:hypothetical protein [Aeromonas piscicola]
MEDDLTWLVRETRGEWLDGDTGIARSGNMALSAEHYVQVDDGCRWFTKEEYLARRSELQNKPVTVTNETVPMDKPVAVAGTGNASAAESSVTACLTEGTENTEDMIERIYWEFDSVRAKKLNPERDIFKRFVRSAMMHIGPAEKLLRLLTTSPDNFTAEDLADLHQLCDTELTKRDAAVCGGQKYLDAHWFERGELPPVGTQCEAISEPDMDWLEVEVIAHRDGFAIVWCSDEKCGANCDDPKHFRPIRTER